MNPFLETEDYKRWLLKPNKPSAIDKEHGDKWNHQRDETLYLIPVILTAALYLALLIVFCIASLRAKRRNKLSSSLLSKIKRVAQLQQEAETIGSSKTLELEENAVETKLQSTVVRSPDKENIIAEKEHVPSSSLEASAVAVPSPQAVLRTDKYIPEREPEGGRKENISSRSSSLPTLSDKMASQLPSRTVSHFSSNKSKDFSFKPFSASINEQVDLESMSKESESSPQVSADTYGKEAKISTSKPKPQEPMATTTAAAAKRTDALSRSTGSAVVEATVKSENIERRGPVDRVYRNEVASLLTESGKNAKNKKSDGPGENTGRTEHHETSNLVIQAVNLTISRLNDFIEKIEDQRRDGRNKLNKSMRKRQKPASWQ